MSTDQRVLGLRIVVPESGGRSGSVQVRPVLAVSDEEPSVQAERFGEEIAAGDPRVVSALCGGSAAFARQLGYPWPWVLGVGGGREPDCGARAGHSVGVSRVGRRRGEQSGWRAAGFVGARIDAVYDLGGGRVLVGARNSFCMYVI